MKGYIFQIFQEDKIEKTLKTKHQFCQDISFMFYLLYLKETNLGEYI